MISRLLVLLFSFSAVSLQARLGETERDCFMRYSSAIPDKKVGLKPEPLIAGARELTYRYQNWEIRVAYVNGKVEAQSYKKAQTHPNKGRITDEEVAAILTAEAGGYTWERLVVMRDLGSALTQFLPVLGQKLWKRSDGALASLPPVNYELHLFSKSALENSQRQKQAAEAAKKASIPKF
jgi:hypothetical protein